MSSERQQILNFVNGEFIPSSNKRTFDNFDPTTGISFADVHEASESDVDAAVLAAHAARRGECVHSNSPDKKRHHRLKR